jgi:hypothetical protein
MSVEHRVHSELAPLLHGIPYTLLEFFSRTDMELFFKPTLHAA